MKRNISKDSPARTVELSPHRINRSVREALDTAKMSGSWECELSEEDFNFCFAGDKSDHGWFENVHVFRAGKRDSVIESETRTTEDLLAEEAEISRVKRVAQQAIPGQLTRPEDPSYHPQKKPE